MLQIRAVTDLDELNILDLPAAVIEITMGRTVMTFTPMQADKICRVLHTLTKRCRQAGECDARRS